MVKFKCVIYLGLWVAESRTRTHTHALTGCNLPGAYGWPSIPLHLSYTQTAQTHFALPSGDGETETNFLRPAKERVRNHTLTGMFEINALDG